METPGRLVERLPNLQCLDRLIVDRPFVLAFQHVPEHRAGVAVRWARLAGRQRDLDGRCLALLAIDLLGDVLFGDYLGGSFAGSVMACQRQATKPQNDTDGEG